MSSIGNFDEVDKTLRRSPVLGVIIAFLVLARTIICTKHTRTFVNIAGLRKPYLVFDPRFIFIQFYLGDSNWTALL